MSETIILTKSQRNLLASLEQQKAIAVVRANQRIEDLKEFGAAYAQSIVADAGFDKAEFAVDLDSGQIVVKTAEAEAVKQDG
jgi:hypothetical protein